MGATFLGFVMIVIGVGLGLKGGFGETVNLQILTLSIVLTVAGIGFLLFGPLWDIREALVARNQTSAKQASQWQPGAQQINDPVGEFLRTPSDQAEERWNYKGEIITKRLDVYYVGEEKQGHSTLERAKSKIDSRQGTA